MKNKVLTIALLTIATLTVSGCRQSGSKQNSQEGSKQSSSQSGQTISYEKGDKIYTERILFDTSAEKVINPSFKLDNGDKTVETAKLGRVNLEFGVKNGVITFNGQQFKDAGAGDKNITVTYSDGSTKKIPALLATKFLYTAEDFQSMNEELTGIYVMAQDIDFTDMENFEPIGHYTYEEDPDNAYFHGVFDGDGYSLRNLVCSYSDGEKGPSDSGYPSNYDVYTNHPRFQHEGHKNGDNIGVFQIIGSSGIVRNVTFDNVLVHGRTICGIVAGNLSGTAENILIRENCEVLMDTHFWDDDCNVGGAFGIVAGSGVASHIVSLTKKVSIRGSYEDYSDEYVGNPGTGYDHGYSTNNNFWRFWGNNKVNGAQEEYLDSNGKKTNGVYSVIGKCWGSVSNSVGASFTAIRFGAEQNAAAAFGQTHVGVNKPTSGDADMGELSNCNTYEISGLKSASNYAGFDASIWNIVDGKYPKLQQNINAFIIAE